MARSGVIAATAILLASGGAPLASQEIFWDGFEVGDLCAWANPPVTVYQEAEAFDEHTNDIDSDAESIGRCAVVVGTIGEPEFGAIPDSDWYEILVEGHRAPAGHHRTVQRHGRRARDPDFEPEGDFRNSSPYETFGLTPLGGPSEDPSSTTRQIYLPENGFDYLDPAGSGGLKDIPSQNNHWLVIVDDERNYPLDSDPPADPPVGGSSLCYRMTLAIDPVVGQYAVPLNEADVQMPADGSVRSYRLEGVSYLDLAETFADRSGVFFDTKLYLIAKTGNVLDTIKGSDDFDEATTVDSKLGLKGEPIPLPEPVYFVMIDPYSNGELGLVEFPVTLQFVQGLWH